MNRIAVFGFAVGVGLLGAAAGVGVPRYVAAAETHTNCITFDSNGNLVSLTPNCTQTISQQGGGGFSFPATNPCTGDSGTLAFTFAHQVYHINVDGAGDAWDSGTFSGTGAFAPDDPSKPSGSGPFATWFGDSFNAQNTVQTFTFTFSFRSTNGQTIVAHEVGHVTFKPGNPVVPVVSFDKFSLSCH